MEHDPDEIWSTQAGMAAEAVSKKGLKKRDTQDTVALLHEKLQIEEVLAAVGGKKLEDVSAGDIVRGNR